MSVTDPYASSYPVSWGAEVTVIAKSGASFKVSRRDCKGDPELALDSDEMRAKAIGLLRYGGLDEKDSNRVCDQVLGMPSAAEKPRVFSSFSQHLAGI